MCVYANTTPTVLALSAVSNSIFYVYYHKRLPVTLLNLFYPS